MQHEHPLSRVNCAGQGCSDREECRRYKLTLPLDPKAKEPAFEWASFDLERLLFLDCPAFVRFRRG